MNYILSRSLENKEIQCFSSEILVVESQKLCNQGLKAFQDSNFEFALRLLEKSIRINPSNELSYWNLARIYGMKNERVKALEFYQNTGKLLGDRKLRKKWIEERDDFRKSHKVPNEPLQIRY